MASIYDLKPGFQALLRPLVNRLAAKGVTPNQITALAMILSFTAGGLVYFNPTSNWPLLTIPVVLFLRMALNAVDGMLAREHNMKTSLGAILNELGDVLSDAALYLPLALVDGINASLIVLVVLLSVISEMTGVIAVQIGAQRRYDGPMGKSDRAFVFGVIGLIVGLGYSTKTWLDYVLVVMLVLLCVTVFNRARRALMEVQ
jgi:CDP-diacylglycerol--glycerol-3-phosphate 3-phosphatidyltransferase